jgi:hypothetical protein
MFGAGNVADYYEENSYGSHTLSGIVTEWLTATINTPTTWTLRRIRAGGRARAGRGYNPYCTEAGLRLSAFRAAGRPWRRVQAWINQAASPSSVTSSAIARPGSSGSLDCGRGPRSRAP